MNQQPLKMGVIGAGHLGRIHAKLLNERSGVELVGVVDPSREAREAIAQQCQVPAFSDWHDIVSRIDAAVIAAPTKFHHEISLGLIGAGIHVMVEKPISMTLGEADEIVAAADRKGVVLQVGHIERFNPVVRGIQLSELRPKYIEANRFGPITFRSTDVGVVLDLMIHDIDLVLAMTDGKVERIDALGVSVLGDHEDIAQARITFDCGAVANLNASRVSHQPDRSMRIFDDFGSTSIDFGTRTATRISISERLRDRTFQLSKLSVAEKKEIQTDLGHLLPIENLGPFEGNALVDELTDFTECITENRAPLVSGRGGLAALEVAKLILASIETHSWDGNVSGRIGPHAATANMILPVPHWYRGESPKDVPRREAG